MAVLDTMRTDIMHKAAVTIQRHARGFMVRRQTQRTRRAIIKIQVPHPSQLWVSSMGGVKTKTKKANSIQASFV